MSNEQESVRITWRIGLKRLEQSWHFEEPVIKEACRLGGGCSVQHETGYWIKGSEHTQHRYSGQVNKEFCFTLTMTVPGHSLHRVLQYMQSAICQEAKAKGIDTDWVHVEWESVITRHFSIKELKP